MTHVLLGFLLLVLLFGALGLFVTKAFLIGLTVVILIGLIGGRRVQSSRRAESERQGYIMTKGSVTKLVNTFGSTWGRIRPDRGSREIFFNVASLDKPADFSSIEVGQAVEFDERADHLNGAHAEHVALAPSYAATNREDS